MTLDFDLRPACADDALVLSTLAAQVFLDTYATSGVNRDLAREVRSVFSEAAVLDRLSRADVETVVAEREGYLIGFLELASGTQCPVEGLAGVAGWEVARLYVQAPFQGSGVGRRLMDWAERRAMVHAEAQAQAHIWLTAWSGNHRALGFYRHLGYADAGATEYVIEGRGYENRVMVKRLPCAPQGDSA